MNRSARTSTLIVGQNPRHFHFIEIITDDSGGIEVIEGSSSLLIAKRERQNGRLVVRPGVAQKISAGAYTELIQIQNLLETSKNQPGGIDPVGFKPTSPFQDIRWEQYSKYLVELLDRAGDYLMYVPDEVIRDERGFHRLLAEINQEVIRKGYRP